MSSDFTFALMLTIASGLCTVLGGTLAFFVKPNNVKFLGSSLAFSAGVMVYISLVEIFPSGCELLAKTYSPEKAYYLTTLSFFIGIIVIMAFDRLIPGFEEQSDLIADSNKKITNFNRLKRTGVMIAAVITIHNLPEGLITFIAALQDPKTGVAIAIAIAIHNIPEGMAVSVPIYYATGSKKKAFYYTLLSGVAEPVGALLGYWLLLPFMNDMVLGILFSAIAGVMVFIAVDELLPASWQYSNQRLSVYSFVAGMGLMAASLILFM
jgi:ZIP family zinc transporter